MDNTSVTLEVSKETVLINTCSMDQNGTGNEYQRRANIWMAQYVYNCSGIVSTADQTNATYLPLESLDAHVFIADVSARVCLKQLYFYNGSDMLPEAYYVFPVPARAAVCSFEVKSRDGVELKGVVKELSQARQDYEEARSKGWLSGFLEQFRQDVFVVSIGSMPPNIDVTVLISYVVDLSEDDQIDTVRFQLSSHVRARYGAPSNSVLYHDNIHRAPLRVTIDIEMPGAILEVTSINHNPLHDMPLVPNSGTPHALHYARKQFTSLDLFDLQKDFLLIVSARGLGKPRCLAEHLSHDENSLHGRTGPTTALACTIVPRFDIKAPSAMQEYLFLVDRSGSMTGMGIEMAKETLKLLLKRIPSTNALFNIYSFGICCISLWSSSRSNTTATVFEANNHVELMDADLGGTEMLGALQTIFRTRQWNIPTCIFVLTDGQIYNIDQTVQAVRSVVVNSPITAPLRVFTLGMGSGASTELCQRLALAGNGSHMMTVDGEPLAFKAIRLVDAMQTPQVEEMKISWGCQGLDEVRQAPHRIPAISPGMRLLITAIIPGSEAPTEVTIMLRLSDKTTLDYRVPVQVIPHHIPAGYTEGLRGQTDLPPLIHTLSAHLLIQDVEGGDRQPLDLQAWAGLTPEARRSAIKKYIVELGTQYQIASSLTAFVAIAVPKASARPTQNRRKTSRKDSQHSSKHSDSSPRGSSTGGTTSSGPVTNNGQGNGTQGSDAGTGGKTNVKGSKSTSKTSITGSPNSKASKASPPAINQTPAGSRGSPSHSPQGDKPRTSQKSSNKDSQSPTSNMPGAYRHSPNPRTTSAGWKFDFFTHKSSPESAPRHEVLCIPDPRGGSPTIFIAPPPSQTMVMTIAKSWLNSLRSFIFPKGPAGRSGSSAKMTFPVTNNPLIPKEIMAIAELQASDGSFSHVSWELSSIVGIPEARLRSSAPSSMAYGADNESIWATAIAVAFYQKRLGSHVALWEDTSEAARRFGSRMCGGDDQFESIVQEASKLF